MTYIGTVMFRDNLEIKMHGALDLMQYEIESRQFYARLMKLKRKSLVTLQFLDLTAERHLIRGIYNNVLVLKDIALTKHSPILSVTEVLESINGCSFNSAQIS